MFRNWELGLLLFLFIYSRKENCAIRSCGDCNKSSCCCYNLPLFVNSLQLPYQPLWKIPEKVLLWLFRNQNSPSDFSLKSFKPFCTWPPRCVKDVFDGAELSSAGSSGKRVHLCFSLESLGSKWIFSPADHKCSCKHLQISLFLKKSRVMLEMCAYWESLPSMWHGVIQRGGDLGV